MEVLPVESVYSSQAAVGDMLVLSPYDPLPPSGWALVASERAPANVLDPSAPRAVLETVYRFGG